MTSTMTQTKSATKSAAAAAASPRASSSSAHGLLASFVPKSGAGAAGRIVTASELADNCGLGSASGLAWTAVHGHVFDITDFSLVHPGGASIRFAAGRDSTCLLESYHPQDSITKVEAALFNKTRYVGLLQCGATEDQTSPKPSSKAYVRPDDAFFLDVRARVDKLIKASGATSYRSTYEVLGTAESFLTCALYMYACYMVGVWGSWGWTLALGLLTGRMGFLMHMGNHCATSSSPKINAVIGWFMGFIGSNPTIWGYEHQVAHHMDPNELHKDNDCEIGNPLVRMHPLIPHTPMQKYQHITVPMAITIGFFKWYVGDFSTFMAKQIGNVRMAIDREDWVWFLTFKVWWMVVHVMVPVYYNGWGLGLLQLFVFMGLGGHYLENIFIVNHIQNGLVPPAGAHWANKQVLATSNWKSTSTFWNWVSGGLNHQVEHHMFPALSYFWYPHISPIVKQCCAEHGLPYENYPDLITAWVSMWTYLRDLGREDFVSKTGMHGAPEAHEETAPALKKRK